MRRKGQAINIDWSIGLGLFLVTTLSAIVMMSTMNFSPGELEGLKNKADSIQDSLRDESSYTGRKVPLIVNTPVEISDIPIDRSYIFPSLADAESGAMTVPAEVNISNQNVRTVIDAKNTSYPMTFFYDDLEDISYSNSITLTASRINNDFISVNPGENGLTSLQVQGLELLRYPADLGSSDNTMTEKELHAETLGGDLKVYSGSPEMILENAGTTTWYLENHTTLYWAADNHTEDLAGSGGTTIEQGSTKGFTIASSEGITFIGDMDVTVTKPNSSTVKAEINTNGRLRIRPHDTNYVEGWKRSQLHENGNILFGAAQRVHGPTLKGLTELQNLSQTQFESRLNLRGWGYNISFIEYKQNTTAQLLDWSGSFDGTSVSRDADSGDLGIGYENGDASDSLIGYWRFDSAVSGSGGTVEDYSGNNNDGTTQNGVKTDSQGVFNTSGYSFDGSNEVRIPDQADFNITDELTVSLWIKPHSLPFSNWNDIVNRYDRNNGWDIIGNSDSSQVRLETWKNSNPYFIDSPPLKEDVWHNIVLVFDKDRSKELVGYLDGEKFGAVTAEIGSLNQDIFIASQYGSPEFNGSIDELRIYNRSLSSSEIKNMFNEKAPYALWSLDKGWGSMIKDHTFPSEEGVYSSPGPASEKRYIVNEYHAGRNLEVVSYMDDNTLNAGSCSQTLNEGGIYTFSSSCYNVGDTVTGTKPFSAHFAAGGSDGPVPASFAGTEFIYEDCRDPEWFNIIAPGNAASVSIKNSTTTVATTSVPAGGHVQVNTDMPGSVFTVESDNPVLVTYDRSMGDTFMMHPASTNVWGMLETIFVSKDNTKLTGYDSNGNIVFDTVADKFSRLGGVGNNQGGSTAIHVVANQSALGGYRCADADNGEADIGVSDNRMATDFIIPRPIQGIDNKANGYYISITTSKPATCDIYYSDGSLAGTRTTSNSPPYPGFIEINSEEDFNLSAGSKISCDAPAMVQWEPSKYEGESNLYGMKNWPEKKFGKGLEFNGNDYIDIDTRRKEVENFTAMGWVNYHELSQSSGNFASGLLTSIDTGFEWGIYAGDGSIRGYLRPDSTSEIMSISANENEWYHVTLVKRGDTMEMFLNGNSVSERTSSNIQGKVAINNLVMGRGTNTHTQQQWLDGEIDEIRVYDYALSDKQIKEIHDQNTHYKSLEGSYTKQGSSDQLRTWRSVTVDADTPSGTSAKMNFSAIDDNGNVEKEQSFDLLSGENTYSLSVPITKRYRIEFMPSSNNPVLTPVINYYELEYGRGVVRGDEIPLSKAVIVNSRPTALLNRSGQFQTMESEVAVWR